MPSICSACGFTLPEGALVCPGCDAPAPTVLERRDDRDADELRDRLQRALGSRFEVSDTLGVGGFAHVYRATDHRLQRDVAIKVLRPEIAAQEVAARRFSTEAQLTARIQHPNVIPIYDVDEDDGLAWLVMPLLTGGTLRDVPKPIEAGRALDLLRQITRGLHVAHEAGIVHRDLKPENVMLEGDRVILADFGIAKAVASDVSLTASAFVVGTPRYMSPEQTLGEPVDARTDIYSLGCVGYELLAGRPPFEGKTVGALAAQHVTASPAPLGEGPLPRAITRCLEKDPDDRWPDAASLLEVLESIGRGADVAAELHVPAPTSRRRIAVLPPVAIGPSAELDYLVLGLHEALISHLGRGEIPVLARTSVQHFRDTQQPPREICEALDVEAIVESSLFCVGEAMQVQVRLVDGASEETRWSSDHDGHLSEVLGLYRRVTTAVTDGVHSALDVSLPTPATTGGAVDPSAYQNYMRGRLNQQSFNPADLDRALEYYAAALEIQPDYAAAYSGIALVWGSKAVLGLEPPEVAGPEWRRAAERAASLDPGLAEAHQALAQGYTWYEFDWQKAEDAYEKAIALDPAEPQARIFYAHFLAMHHRVRESDHHIARAFEIDPFNPFTQLMRGIQRGLVGRHAESVELIERVPANPLRSFALSWQRFNLDDLEGGLADYRTYFELLGDREIASALEEADDPRSAMMRAAELLARRAEQRYVKPNNIIHLFGWAGDVDRAVTWLEHAVKTRDHEVAYMASPLASEGLRSDPRFRAILQELRLPG